MSTGDDQTPESWGGVIREWYNVTPSLNDMKARDQFVAYNGCRQLCACVARGTGKLPISHSSQLQRALQPIRLLNIILAL